MGLEEVHALAEAILNGARVAGLGVTVSFDDGLAWRVVYVNEAAAKILGYAVYELIGSRTAIIFAAEEQARLEDFTACWRRGETAVSPVEMVALRKDGSQVPIEAAFSFVALQGEPAIVTFVRDIRERKMAEEALRRSEKRFRQLIEAAPDAIAVHRDGRFVYVNPAHANLFGRRPDEVVNLEVTKFVHPDDRDVVQRQREAFEQGESQEMAQEYRVVRPDGHVVSVELLSILIEYEGQPAVLAFARDTTERKLMQAQLAFADRTATLGMIAAGVAHEINNPVAYAALNVESIARYLPRLDDDVRTAVVPAIEAARDGLARVATIVRDLRGLSSPRSEERWPVDVEEVLESAVSVAMHAIRGRTQLVRAYHAVPPLKTDPARLGQVLLNLLFNAVQSFEGGDESTNELHLGIASLNADEVVITVGDNGPGIPKEDLERIFDPFFTTKKTGTGLGLAISQTLITSIGGKLEVVSALGRGTKFDVRLPTPTGDRTCE